MDQLASTNPPPPLQTLFLDVSSEEDEEEIVEEEEEREREIPEEIRELKRQFITAMENDKKLLNRECEVCNNIYIYILIFIID